MANRQTDPRRMRPPRVRHARLKDAALPELLNAALCSARLIGGCCVLVENHRGLSELGETRIAVATECGMLEVRGEGLCVCNLRRDSLLVRGRIDGVGYADA